MTASISLKSSSDPSLVQQLQIVNTLPTSSISAKTRRILNQKPFQLENDGEYIVTRKSEHANIAPAIPVYVPENVDEKINRSIKSMLGLLRDDEYE